MKRRAFLKSTLTAGAATSLSSVSCQTGGGDGTFSRLDEVLQQPVLKQSYFKNPVMIEMVALRRYQDNFIVHVRCTDGAEGYSVCNNAHMRYLYPIVNHKMIPFFEGKDARQLDQLIEELYVTSSNYKLQGLALWISLASVEFAILDMLGQIAGKSIGQLIGDIHNTQIAVYRANNHRGKSAQESIQLIKRSIAETGAKALKIKIGGRMSNNRDYPPGRTEALIPLVRETFGPDMTIYADSNGSYTVDKAIEVGHILEKYAIEFYEEPVPWDWLEETKAVADALTVPVAGGEQETSMHRFRWQIGNHALDIVQPDMFYFGGMIRSTRVARMAAALGKPCVPHISGSGLGFVYMLHFVSTVANAGLFHEFKGVNKGIPFECPTSSLQSENGTVNVPSGPGLGLTMDPDFISKHDIVQS